MLWSHKAKPAKDQKEKKAEAKPIEEVDVNETDTETEHKKEEEEEEEEEQEEETPEEEPEEEEEEPEKDQEPQDEEEEEETESKEEPEEEEEEEPAAKEEEEEEDPEEEEKRTSSSRKVAKPQTIVPEKKKFTFASLLGLHKKDKSKFDISNKGPKGDTPIKKTKKPAAVAVAAETSAVATVASSTPQSKIENWLKGSDVSLVAEGDYTFVKVPGIKDREVLLVLLFKDKTNKELVDIIKHICEDSEQRSQIPELANALYIQDFNSEYRSLLIKNINLLLKEPVKNKDKINSILIKEAYGLVSAPSHIHNLIMPEIGDISFDERMLKDLPVEYKKLDDWVASYYAATRMFNNKKRVLIDKYFVVSEDGDQITEQKMNLDAYYSQEHYYFQYIHEHGLAQFKEIKVDDEYVELYSAFVSWGKCQELQDVIIHLPEVPNSTNKVLVTVHQLKALFESYALNVAESQDHITTDKLKQFIHNTLADSFTYYQTEITKAKDQVLAVQDVNQRVAIKTELLDREHVEKQRIKETEIEKEKTTLSNTKKIQYRADEAKLGLLRNEFNHEQKKHEATKNSHKEKIDRTYITDLAKATADFEDKKKHLLTTKQNSTRLVDIMTSSDLDTINHQVVNLQNSLNTQKDLLDSQIAEIENDADSKLQEANDRLNEEYLYKVNNVLLDVNAEKKAVEQAYRTNKLKLIDQPVEIWRRLEGLASDVVETQLEKKVVAASKTIILDYIHKLYNDQLENFHMMASSLTDADLPTSSSSN
jgi:hypothetical protein